MTNTVDREAQDRTREYLKPKAWGWMMKELEPWSGQEHLLDPRDAEPFVAALCNEIDAGRRMGQYPVVAYEEFSPSIAQPRTVHLLEALKFLIMTGHVAFISDRRAPAPRNGYLAQLLVI